MDQGNQIETLVSTNAPLGDNTSSPQATEPQAAQPQQNPQTPAPVTPPCKCPTINTVDWDKKRQKLNKSFHKTFSPRLLYYPFSFVIDVDRATRGAARKGYKPVENGMILDTGGMFWGSVLVEVTNANLEDKDVVSFANKEVYTKVCKGPWNEIKKDMEELTKELGAQPLELYTWWTSCPKCVMNKEVKAILIAVTAQSIPEQQTQAAQGQAASTQPTPAQPQTEDPTQPAEPQTPQPEAQPPQAQQAAPQEPAAPDQPAQPQAPQPAPPEPPAQASQPAAPSEQPPQNPPQG